MENRRAAIGRTVIFPMLAQDNNGASEAPATITRVWGHGEVDGGGQQFPYETINVRVLGDNAAVPEWRTSIKLFQTEHEARAAVDAILKGMLDGSTAPEAPAVAWWPTLA